MRRALHVGVAFALLASAPEAHAQSDALVESLVATVNRLQRRMQELETERSADRQRIRNLEEQLGSASASTPVATGVGNQLNPRITAFVDGGGSLSNNSDDTALNRFNLREAEIDLRAAVSPVADGVLIAAFAEQIDIGDDETTIDTSVELEEAYIDAHSLIEDVGLKFGKFRAAFGVDNRLHTHDLPQVTRPLATAAFLGPEGLKTTGVSASWLVPNPWETWIELTAEVTNADAGEESPILAGPDADNPAVLARLAMFEELSDDSTLELGTSFIHGRGEPPYVLGGDATWTWRDPEKPDFESLLLQGEVYWSNSEFGDDAARDSQFGAYAFGQYQFRQNWYAGLRYDYTDTPSTEAALRDSTWGLSPYVTWYASEALRLRLEFQHLEHDLLGGGSSEQAVMFGITWFIGAHPPHPYWVNR